MLPGATRTRAASFQVLVRVRDAAQPGPRGPLRAWKTLTRLVKHEYAPARLLRRMVQPPSCTAVPRRPWLCLPTHASVTQEKPCECHLSLITVGLGAEDQVQVQVQVHEVVVSEKRKGE